SPVLGLRPGRWFLRRRSKLPKPESLTWRPPCRASRSALKKASTNSFASRLFRPTSTYSRSAISAFVNAMPPLSSSPDPRAVRGRDGAGDGGHHRIDVVVGQRARMILQNQAHGYTLESRFHALPGVDIEQAQRAQEGARGGLGGRFERAPGHVVGNDECKVAPHRRELRQRRRPRQRTQGQRGEIELEGHR